MTKYLLRRFVYSLLGSIVSATHLYAGIFTYEARSFDVDQGLEACKSTIEQAAIKFKTDSGQTVISSGCEVESILDRITGKIVYSAPERVMPWSTTSTTYGEDREFYTSRAQCETALEQELSVFRNLTGLEPFLAVCHKTSAVGSPRYRTRIDAIGTSSVRRFETTANLNYSIYNPNRVIESLNNQAIALNLTPIGWYQGPGYRHQGLSVVYYGTLDPTAPYRLHGKDSRFFTSIEECTAAQDAFDQTRTSNWNGVTACSAAHPTVGFQLNLLWWDQGIGSDLILPSTILPESYSSLGACSAMANDLSQQLSRDGDKIAGIVCGRESNPQSPIKMEVISYNP